MRCNVCGSELEAGTRVCKYCGNELDYTAELDLYDNHDIYKDTEYGKNFDEFDDNSDIYTKTDEIRRENKPERDTASNVKYCRYCGRPLDMSTMMCSFCSERELIYKKPNVLYNEEREMAQRYNNKPKTRTTVKKKKKKSNPVKNALIITLVMVILFTVSFIIFFRMLGGSFLEESATETPEITETISPSAMPTILPTTPAPKETAKTGSAIKTKETQEPKETPKPRKTAQPEQTTDNASPSSQGTGRNGYIYPSDEKLITEEELDTLSRQDIKLIYWEMYARYGYTFDYDDLIEYFEGKSWYVPTTTDSNSVETKFNSIERENKRIIEDYQKQKGWRT